MSGMLAADGCQKGEIPIAFKDPKAILGKMLFTMF